MTTWDGQNFSRTELERMENGPVFLEIIRTSDDPKKKISAFVSLRETYGSVLADATRNFGGSPSYVEVVLEHLDDPNPALQTAALRAASHCMGDDPVPEVQSALARLLTESNDARIRFLAERALDQTETRPTEMVTSARLQALDDPKAFVAAKVLHDLNVNDVRDQAALQNKLFELLNHENPAVRGEAIKRLSDIPRNRVKAEFVAKVIRPFLQDPHPYPRGRAVIALGNLLKEKAIPDIVKLAGDRKESRYKLEFQDPDGEADFTEDWTFSWGRVDEAVVRKIAAITFDKPHSFNLGPIFYETRAEDIEREAGLVQTWYEKNREALEKKE
ncbi:MAG: HEAT repeat domain-containing protein [Candidatus Eremiobacteraeota bacterium]|nr:HEAT repeat domain-containing protein [Candidatus Eremiobacteraeota bacterium]